MTPFRADARKNMRTSRRRQRRPNAAASEHRGECCCAPGRTRVHRIDEKRLMFATEKSLKRSSLCILCTAVASMIVSGRLLAQAVEYPELSIELIDPKVLRVCADPHNMPFSTDKGEGFENKL